MQKLSRRRAILAGASTAAVVAAVCLPASKEAGAGDADRRLIDLIAERYRLVAAMNALIGPYASDAAFDRCGAAIWEVEEAIFALPPATLAGLAAKYRLLMDFRAVFERLDQEHPEDMRTLAILHDIERLSGAQS